MFKIWIRTFCSENRLIDRNYVLSLLKNEKLKSRLTYGAIASKLNKTEVILQSSFTKRLELIQIFYFIKSHLIDLRCIRFQW